MTSLCKASMFYEFTEIFSALHHGLHGEPKDAARRDYLLSGTASRSKSIRIPLFLRPLDNHYGIKKATHDRNCSRSDQGITTCGRSHVRSSRWQSHEFLLNF